MSRFRSPADAGRPLEVYLNPIFAHANSFIKPHCGGGLLLVAAFMLAGLMVPPPTAQAQQQDTLDRVRQQHLEQQQRQRREAEMRERMRERQKELQAQIRRKATPPAPSGVVEQDSLALVALYNSTDGENWDNNDGWLEAPVAEWYGVTVSGDRVVSLDLMGDIIESFGLNGSLPPELGDLTALQGLNLDENELTGDIPPELSQLSDLESLRLKGNQLTGEIPAELGQLSSLQGLNLAQNELTGEIPPELSDLAYLEFLNLEFNQLTGDIPPELSQLSDLESLRLKDNQLTGEIPVELGQLSSLQYLYLGSNQLTGEIPAELGDLSGLQGLYLGDNELTGEIPLELSDLAYLEFLDLEVNQLTGDIPPELSQLSGLKDLYLRYNELTGEIPPELGDLTALRRLYLNDNQLTGAVPLSFTNLVNLTTSLIGTFRFDDTDLCEPSDPEFQDWIESIYSVESTGVMCSEIGELVAYYLFDGNANDVSGNGNDGTLYGDPQFVEGQDGQAISFDGDDDFVQTDSSQSLRVNEKLTFAAWVFVDLDEMSRKTLAVQGTTFDTDGNWEIRVRDDGSFTLGKNNVDGNARSDGSISTRQWRHVAITFSAGTTKFYIDGQLDSEKDFGALSFNTTSAGIKIGDREYTGDETDDFKGEMDEVRLYDRTLTAEEVQELYSGNGDNPPTITSVEPDPVTGSDDPQPFTINGSDFEESANVTLRDLDAGETFPNREISSFSPTEIVINPTFTTEPATWSVEVINPNGDSSGAYEFEVVEPGGGETPAAPTGLTATAGDGEVALSWDANEESDLTGYNVYRSTSPFSDTSGATRVNVPLVGNASFTDTGLSNGKEYFYRVTAVDTEGNESSPSGQSSAAPSSTGIVVRLTSVRVRPEDASSFSEYAPSEVLTVQSGVDLRFEGIVTDAEGSPVSGQQIQVYNSFQYAPGSGDDGIRTVTTAEDGTFEYPSGGSSIATESVPAGVRPFWFSLQGTDEAIPFATYLDTGENIVEQVNETLATAVDTMENLNSARADTTDDNPFADLAVPGQSYPTDDMNLSSSANDNFFLYYYLTYAGPTNKTFLLSENQSTGWLARGFDLNEKRVSSALENLPERFEGAVPPPSAVDSSSSSSINALQKQAIDLETASNIASLTGKAALCGAGVLSGAIVGCAPLAGEAAKFSFKQIVSRSELAAEGFCPGEQSLEECIQLSSLGVLIGETAIGGFTDPTRLSSLNNALYGASTVDTILEVIELSDAELVSNSAGEIKAVELSLASDQLLNLTLPLRPILRTDAQFDNESTPSTLGVSVSSTRAIYERGTTIQSSPSLQIGESSFPMSPVDESSKSYAESGTPGKEAPAKSFQYRAEIPVSELPGYTGDPGTWNETIRVKGNSFETLQGTGTSAFCGIEEETFTLASPQTSKEAGNVGIEPKNGTTALASTELNVPAGAFGGSTSFVDLARVSYSQVARPSQSALRPRSPVVQVMSDRVFSNPATLTLGLEAEGDDFNNTNLYWRGESGPWQQVPATVDLTDSTATAEVSLPGYYAVLTGEETSPPAEKPAQVQLAYPTDRTDGIPELPRLSWEGADGAAQYRVQVSTRSDFPTDSLQEYTTGGTAVTTDRLQRETTYYWRVRAENSAGGGLWSEASRFSTRLASVPFNVTQSFGGAEEAGDYRLVALPGQVGRPLGNAINGNPGIEWQAFWDDGSSEGYLAKYDGTDTFTFRRGQGFWLTSTQDWTLSDSVEAVPLGSDRATAIPLHEGWNIISNPLRKGTSWSAVQETHSDSLQPAWAFEGSFRRADTLRSATTGKAYYFLNDQGLDSLTVPYPTSTRSESERTLATESQGERTQDKQRAAVTLVAQKSETLTSEIQIGISPEAVSGLGPRDVVAPPARFSALSLRLEPDGDTPARKGLLAIEWRPPTSETEDKDDGHTFSLQLQAETSASVEIRAKELRDLKGREVVLLAPASGQSWNLRSEKTVTLPKTDSTALKLAVGRAAYVQDREQEIIPDEVSLTSYPNPMRRQATLEYTLTKATDVRIEVYDVLGRRVAVLANGPKEAGRHQLQFDGGRLASGVYFGRLETEEQTRTQKITVVR